MARDAKTLTQNGWIELKEETSVAPDQFFERYGASLGLALNPKLTIQSVKSETGAKGVNHQRFQVYYDNIVVEGMEYSLHSRDNKVQWARGRIVSEIEINTKEVLSEREALLSALKELGIDGERYEKEKPQTERVIAQANFNDYSPGNFKLTYKFLLTSTRPFDIFHAYVDARTGRVLRKITTIQNCFAPDALHPAPSTAPVIHSHGGEDALAHTLVASTFIPNKARYLQGQTNRAFETESVPNSSNQQLAWRNFAAGRFDLQVKEYTNTDFALNGNTPAQQDQIFDNMPLVTNPNTTWQANHQEATTTHWAMEQTQNYYQSVHQRNGPANNGRIGRVVTNVPSNAFAPDFFGPARFTQYGNVPGWDMIMLQSGPGQSWSTLDILAHEYTHGFTQYTNNLVYAGESGALNEGISDILAYCVERKTFPNDWNWALAEDANGTSFRDMQNPLSRQQPDTFGGTSWVNTNGCVPTRNNDWCGVHTNSGVLNHWFYLLNAGGTKNGVTVAGISFERAEAIVYDAFANRMQSTDQYADARLATLAAAQALYGSCSTEQQQVGAAWAAVGVGTGSGCGAGCNYTISATVNPTSTTCGSPVTATAICTGPDCNGVTYSWSGNAIPQNGQTSTITTSSSPGTYAYSVQYAKTGCGSSFTFTPFVSVNCNLPLANGCYTIKSKHSDKFMQPENGNNGARIRQYSGNGQNNQIFEMEGVDGDSYKLKAWGTNKVWEAAGAGTGYGTAIQLGDYSGGNHQKWKLDSWGDGSWRMSAKHYLSLLADVEGESSLDGAGLHLWGQHGNNNQRFYVSSVTCPNNTNDCNFTASTSPSIINTSPSSPIVLNSSCSGSGCNGVNYQWSGNGFTSGSPNVILNAPSTAGSYTYTMTISKPGCASSTATVTVNVGTVPPPNCINLGDQCSGNQNEIRSYNLSLSSGGSKALSLEYRSHNEPGTGRIRINGGGWQEFALPQTPGDLSYLTTGIGTYALNSGGNTVELASVNGGYVCFRQLCASSGGARLGVMEEPTTESPELTVSPNPNGGEFEARFFVEPGRKATLRVSDVLGRQVWQKSLTGQGEHRERVRLPAQSVGSYILLLDKEATAASGKTEFKRVIVVK